MYGSLSSLKLRCRVTTATDDALLSELLTAASDLADELAGRSWFVGAGGRAYGRHTALFDSSGALLLLDALINTAQSVTVTNGDGVVVAAGDRFFVPAHTNARAWALGLERGSGLRWEFGDSYDGLIQVTATWIAPEVVDEVAYLLARALYQQGQEGAAPLDQVLKQAEAMLAGLAGMRLGAL